MNLDLITETQWMWIWLFMSAFVGLAIGSFLNVVIYRVPNEMSLDSPPSQCLKCKKAIAWHDNIPLFSYIALRGKCRNCQNKISLRYPMIEFLCAFVWVITTLRLGLHIHTIGYNLFFSGLIALSVIDIDTKLLPKKIVYPTGAILIVFLTISSISTGEYHRLRDSAIVALAYSAFLFIVWFTSGGKAMGFGDVRLAVFLGFAMGYYGFIVSYLGMLASFCIGSIIGIAIATITKGGRKMKIPFGPFLAAGTVLAIWFAPQLSNLIQVTNV